MTNSGTTTTAIASERPLFPPKHIHAKLAAILKELPAIGKDSENTGLKFSFRSIDAVLNKINPLLGAHGVYVVPRVIDVKVEALAKGRAAVVTVEYRFTADDGSEVVAVSVGEGHDWADKAVSKAMTMAFKTCLGQVFAISTEEDPDSDSVQQDEVPSANPSSQTAASSGQAGVGTATPPAAPPNLDDRRTWCFERAKAMQPADLNALKEKMVAAGIGMDFSSHTLEQVQQLESWLEPF
ncbi:MAG: ERF family protein [Actinobacteria bacterium]|nr:ERF family protein [Actinomycetota bacterium]